MNTGREVRSGTIVFTTTDPKVRVEIPVRQNFGETIGRAPIRDLMLIYDGYDDGRAFDDKRFAKYAASDDDAPQWLFDGYLFLTAHRGGKSFSGGLNRPASNKQDWEAIVDFYLEDTHSIPALDRAVGALRDQIGGTFHRRKVVIFMPEPQEGQTDWGEIDGKAMDFSNYPDRIAACKWYVDMVVEKFAQHDFRNIQLAGIYWFPEHGGFISTYMKQVAEYIHSKNLDYRWIPYYGAFGHADWKNTVSTTPTTSPTTASAPRFPGSGSTTPAPKRCRPTWGWRWSSTRITHSSATWPTSTSTKSSEFSKNRIWPTTAAPRSNTGRTASPKNGPFTSAWRRSSPSGKRNLQRIKNT